MLFFTSLFFARSSIAEGHSHIIPQSCVLFWPELIRQKTQILHFWVYRREQHFFVFYFCQVSLRLLYSNFHKVILRVHFQERASFHLLVIQVNQYITMRSIVSADTGRRSLIADRTYNGNFPRKPVPGTSISQEWKGTRNDFLSFFFFFRSAYSTNPTSWPVAREALLAVSSFMTMYYGSKMRAKLRFTQTEVPARVITQFIVWSNCNLRKWQVKRKMQLSYSYSY